MNNYILSESCLSINLFIIRKEEIDTIMERYKICCLNYDGDCEFIKCSNCCLLGMFGFCVHIPKENAAHIYIRKLSHYINRSKSDYTVKAAIIKDTIDYINHEMLHVVICHIGEEDAGTKLDLIKHGKHSTFDYEKALELGKKLPTDHDNVR
jgi:hypothetical protein